MKTKRICIVLPDLSVIGAQRAAIDYGKELQKNGFDVDWLVGSGGAFAKGIEKQVRSYGAKTINKLRGLRIAEQMFRLFKTINNQNYDVVISVSPFLNRVLCFGRALRLFRSWLVIEDQCYPPRSYQDEFPSKLSRLFYKRTEWTYNYSDRFRVVSTASEKYYNDVLKKKHATFQENLIDVHRVDVISDSEFRDKPSKKRLVYIGRFTSQKNISYLIKAMSLLVKKVDCELVIIGYGPEESKLKSLVSELKLASTVRFVENSPYNFTYLKTAAAFPMTSIWEGMPVTMIEAMTLGTPVVSTSFQGGPEFLIGDNERGFLVPENDIDALVESLYLCLVDTGLAESRAEKAKAFVHERLDISRNFHRYINTFIAPAFTA